MKKIFLILGTILISTGIFAKPVVIKQAKIIVKLNDLEGKLSKN